MIARWAQVQKARGKSLHTSLTAVPNRSSVSQIVLDLPKWASTDFRSLATLLLVFNSFGKLTWKINQSETFGTRDEYQYWCKVDGD
jgi:hypothetical protein